MAADLATPYEQQRLVDLGVCRYTVRDVQTDPDRVLADLSAWADDLDALSVHVDVDVLDQTMFPIAEEQRDAAGLTLDDLARLMRSLMAHRAARVLTICEINPARPRDPASALRSIVDRLTEAMSSR